MIHEELTNGGGKISLQNTVGTIHAAEIANMQDLISATIIELRSRAIFNETTLVTVQE
jgi:hypothetical protein